MEPALTPEEWVESWLQMHDSRSEALGVPTWESSASTRHGLAALCLYGQPFGFTWEDVELLNACADRERWHIPPLGWQVAAANLADRIAALLPPREQEEPRG